MYRDSPASTRVPNRFLLPIDAHDQSTVMGVRQRAPPTSSGSHLIIALPMHLHQCQSAWCRGASHSADDSEEVKAG
ncbi:unnamed protein product [Urochloa humidicola]